MASLEQIGIRREQTINRLEALVKDIASELGLDASEFTLTVQERDTTILYLKQLEAIADQLEHIKAGAMSRSEGHKVELEAKTSEFDAKVASLKPHLRRKYRKPPKCLKLSPSRLKLHPRRLKVSRPCKTLSPEQLNPHQRLWLLQVVLLPLSPLLHAAW
jgi:hypothetical protein